MPKFSSGYGSKSNIVDNDKILIADSEAADQIKYATKSSLEKGFTGGTLANTIYRTTSGSYVKPAKLKYIIVELVSGGGGGGGIPASTPAGSVSQSGGGGGGGYARKKILASALSASETVTVGSGGSGGASGGGAGGTGGTSSFGSHVSASGGAGGDAGTNSTGTGSTNPSFGGIGLLGDLNLSGGPSTAARRAGSPLTPVTFSNGGQAFMGQGGSASINASLNGTGVAYGGGGSGISFTTGFPALAGYAGAAGIVIIHEYY